MFILAYSYHAKPGQAQELLSLHRDWQHALGQRGLVSAELLSASDDPLECILLARFKDEETAWAAAAFPAYRNWYATLAQLSESGPTVSQYVLEDEA